MPAGAHSSTRLGPPGEDSPGTGRQVADDRGSCKGPHQTAAGL
jgi:hypothetical protein